MQSMRQINLFSRTTKVLTKDFFEYGNTLIFAVPKSKISQAIGKDAVNIKTLNKILRKKIKVVAMPKAGDDKELARFIADVVAPIELSKTEITKNRVEISTNKLDKATLIGRNHSREKELTEILKNNFGIDELKIS